MPRPLAVIAAMLTLSSCASGAKPTQAPLSIDLHIAPAQLRAPRALPDLQAADDDALLRNHVAVARYYHELADQLRALLCSLGSQQGFTLNGAPLVKPAGCTAGDTTGAHGPY